MSRIFLRHEEKTCTVYISYMCKCVKKCLRRKNFSDDRISGSQLSHEFDLDRCGSNPFSCDSLPFRKSRYMRGDAQLCGQVRRRYAFSD